MSGEPNSSVARTAASPQAESLPFVSVVIPCRNEARYITVCLDSILANDYPRNRLEVLIADGMSEDGTREIIDKYSRLRSEVRCLDNPKRITPSALNIGVANARGEVIIRMDAHARIAGDYIRRCVAGLSRYRVDCVGGVMHTLPQEHTPVGRAIAAALGSGFGVGNSRFRVHPSEPTYVDTVFGACYRREVFERVGLFNERLPRTQDFEFNARLRRGGGRILLLPGIVSYYYVRVGLGRFWGDNFNNGVWAVLPFARSRVVPVSWRHLVPLVFVALLMVSALLAPRSAAARLVLAAVAGAYLAAAASASVLIAWRRREPRFLAVMPVVFSALHVAYGLGSLWGLTKISTASALRVLSGARRAIRHALQPEARGRE